MAARAKRATRARRGASRVARPEPSDSVIRKLRAELERLKRKVDRMESEMRRLRSPIRPAFLDAEDDESE